MPAIIREGEGDGFGNLSAGTRRRTGALVHDVAPESPPPRAFGAVAWLAFLFVAAAQPAVAAEWIHSPSPAILYKSSLNNAQVYLALDGNSPRFKVTSDLNTNRSTWFALSGVPSGVTLSVSAVVGQTSPHQGALLTLSYSGNFTSDWVLTITVPSAAFFTRARQVVYTIPVQTDNTKSLWTGTVSGQATEAGGQATFPVRLRAAPSQNVTVAVTSRDTGEGSVSPSTLTFSSSNWHTPQTVTVTGVDDNVDDGTQNWNVRLDPSSADTTYNALTNVDVAVTTTDNDALPTATLSLSQSSISENGGSATVTAALSHPSSGATALTVAASPGSGTDFTQTGTTLNIAAGATSSTGTVTIAATNNSVDAPDKSVTVSATASGASNVANPSSVMLTLTDDEAAPTATLALSNNSIPENGGTSTVSATLSHASSASSTITVSQGTGFTLGSATTLNIAAGATSGSGTVTLTADNDNVHSGDRSVTVTGSMTNTQGAGSVTGASLTIREDEALPTATLALSRSSIDESGADGGSTVTAGLSGASSEATVLTVSTSPGADTVAGDFTQAGTVLTIAAGETSSTGAVTIAAVDNDADTPNKSVTVSATAAGGNGVADPSPLTLTVTDDDGPASAERTGTPRAAPSGAPGGVTVTPGAGRLAVSWTAVTGADGYKVQWKSGAQTYDAARQATVGGSTSHTITGLAAGTEYTVRVIATRTDADDGPASAERTGTPKQSPPGAPGDVTVTPGVGRLAVSWTAATDADGYKVQWKSGAQAYDAARQATVGSGTSHAITGLSAGTEYTVRVVATRTDADDSPASAERTGTPTTGRIDLSAPTLAVTAGGAGETYTVVLGAAPDGEVTVAIASDNGDVTASPDSLSFTASDWSAPQTVTATAAEDDDGYADTASLTHTASGGGYDGVTGTLPVAVTGDSRVKVGGAGETVYRIRGRTVTVAVMPGAPAGVEIDLADLPAAPSGEALTLTFSPVASPAASDAFAFGPPEARTVVDVTVTAGRVPSAGLRLCLPVADAMREAARGRPLLLLRYDGDAWGAVSGSAASADGSLVCADGVSSFSPFAVGYADTAPSFAADAALAALAFTSGETIEPVTLPAATGGDGTSYELGPRPLPPGLRFDDATRVLSGTPTEAFAQRRYTWTATDIDWESDALSFTMEVLPARSAARERLRAVNESVLPELSRAMWGSVIDALTGRLESAGLSVGDGAGVMASGLAGASEFLRSNEGALEAGPGSWRELLAGESFVLGIGSGAGGPGDAGSPVTVWGSGDWRKLSLDDDALDWSGELFSAHVGVDARLGGRVRGGVAASWFEGEIDYTDRSGDAAVSGVHESRLPAVHPWAGWFGADGSRLWGALGYGEGEVEIADADLAERFGVQKSDSAFLAAAAGGSVPVASSAGGFALALKVSGEATRYSVEDNGAAIAAVSVDTQRLRLSATGSRRWALADGGVLTPSLEAGARWDGGDGETGAGVELGGGVEWTLPSRGLSVAARGRTLAAHAGAAEEWGVSGSARLSPPGGRGLSLALSPRWGASESGLSRLWDEGVAGRGSPVGGSDAGAARLEAELGYGFREGAGLLTPSAGFGYGDGGARRWRVGTRFDLGPALAVSVATERRDGAADAGHALRIDLRMSW